MGQASLDHYFSVMGETGHNPGNLRFALRKMFDGVPVAGRSVLEIGAGAGSTSLYAACAGARRVVSLEPGLSGSKGGAQAVFERCRDRLGAEQVILRRETLQEFDPGDEQFDVVISRASINHLDEAACSQLHHDPAARLTYLALLAKIYGLTAPAGALMVLDCARRNLFATLRLKNPLAPTIEWEKHQPPELWAELLAEVGFRDPRIRWWSPLNTLRRPGQVLFGNRVAAYLTTSGFQLTMGA
jgi:SAM-dependent methyltransferase